MLPTGFSGKMSPLYTAYEEDHTIGKKGEVDLCQYSEQRIQGRCEVKTNKGDTHRAPGDSLHYPLFCAFSILAQVSRNGTVRLNTSFPSVESGSTQK